MKHSLALLFIALTLCVATHAGSAWAQTEANSLAPFVIEDGDIDGFSTMKKAEYYRPENLWNYINGGALPYLDYGVGDVVTFSGKIGSDGVEIVVDIYDMSDNLGAFGIYSNERYSDYDFREIGVEGYVGENIVCFWKDRYYIKIFSNAASIPSSDPLLNIARELDKRIPDGGGMSPYFALLPTENRQTKSESYAAKNVLGQDFLSKGFSALYTEGDSEYQFHIIECESPKDAKEKLAKYRAFMKDFAKVEKSREKLGDEILVCREDWYGLMIFVRKGKYIAGSVGLKDSKRAMKHLATIIEKLD